MHYFSVGSISDRNANKSYTHPIPVVLNQVKGVSRLTTLKGDYGHMGVVTAQHMQYRICLLTKSECESMPLTSYNHHAYALKEMEGFLKVDKPTYALIDSLIIHLIHAETTSECISIKVGYRSDQI